MASQLPSMMIVSIFSLLLLLPLFASGDTCLGPTVTPQVYTTPEATTSSETIFIVQFSLTCKNDLTNINLYADINGKPVPATKTTIANQYQVTFSDSHSQLPAGTYVAKFYDEEGYSALRKAQRNNEDIESIKPIFTIDIDHRGVWKGAYIQSEFVAAVVAILVWYFAYNAKSQLHVPN
ncbi:translocon-associated protein subunit delta [Octopus bimaculoides]|uniref:Translocon-associated protein subunit delta n=1 Tax=Octopus bimaculoides TaxID=37653 RepID=A0A0L8FLD4_OCTBM|nr:translocon-associated protein subunit delta [Octopus bimaculoides]|eukprot:XP_014788828.1 PREDICTED: translocon-associated protein subunit delta-like [Octopus bimaculoides]